MWDERKKYAWSSVVFFGGVVLGFSFCRLLLVPYNSTLFMLSRYVPGRVLPGNGVPWVPHLVVLVILG